MTRRWVHGASEQNKGSYRRSLPTRYKATRLALIAVGLLGLVVGIVGWRSDLVPWTKGVFADVTDKKVTIPQAEVAASTVWSGGDHRGRDTAAGANDRQQTTAWTVPWKGEPEKAADESGCMVLPAGAGSLLLTTASAELRAVDVFPGLPAPARDRELVPERLQIQFADGSCESVALKDKAEVQRVAFDVHRSDAVVISVVAVRSNESADQKVSLTKVQLVRRPY
jgi:hypothetical protein